MWTAFTQVARTAVRPWPFSSAVILTIALCTAASATAWAVFYGILLKPLSLPDPDRLVTLGEQYPGVPLGARGGVLSNIAYHVWMDAAHSSIGPIVLYRVAEHTVAAEQGALRAYGAEVSCEIGPVLRAAPRMGRWFSPANGAPEREVVISYHFWREHLSTDGAILGRTIEVDGSRYVVVGVTEPAFAFPNEDVKFWIPLDLRQAEGSGAVPSVLVFNAVARLRPGATPESAEAEGTTALRRLRTTGATSLGLTAAFGSAGAPAIRAQRLKEALTSHVKPALMLIGGAVLAMSVVACANLTSLFLARSTARRRELAIRRSMGATPGRLVAMFLAESALLASLGGALGVALARWLVVIVQGLAPHDVPRLADTAVGASAVLVGLATALTVVLLCAVFGVVGALTRKDDLAAAELGGRTPATLSPATRRAHSALLGIEALCASLVLVGTGLVGLSLVRLLSVNPGYQPGDVFVLRIFMSGDDEASEARRWQVTQRLLDQARQLPGVVAAGAANMFPFDPFTSMAGFPLPGEYRVPLPPTVVPRAAFARRYAVTPGYAEALRLRLLSGRVFTSQDRVGDHERWVVSKEFARLYLPPNPLGRRFPWTAPDGVRDSELEIIGIVDDVLKDGLDAERQPEIYALMRDGTWGDIKVVVRCARASEGLAVRLRSLATSLAPDAAVEVTALDALLADSVSGPRFLVILVGLFAAIVIALACGGLYAVTTFSVSRRRHELAIRVALGARRPALVWLVMTQALVPTVFGVLAGLGCAVIAARQTANYLFRTSAFEPAAFGLTGGALLLVAMLAAGMPALRAASVAPADVLRSD